MCRKFWIIAIVHIYQLLQVNSVSKRSLNVIDLSTVTSEEKLPSEVAPTSYVLDVYPIPDEAYFKGTVTINLSWQEETNKIVLHADPELVIYQTELVVIEDDSPPRTVRVLRSERDPERSWLTVYLRKPLSAGTQARLSMTFTGKLETQAPQGLYLGTYEDTNAGETKHFVGSNFKPNFARKVFPCYDEPGYKVPFTVSVVRPNSMRSLSNMPLVRSEELSFDPTWTRDHFQESLPMTTYSLGLLVSDFNSISLQEDTSEGEKNFDARVQIWGTPELLDSVQNVSETISTAIKSAGDILGVSYPLPKLDYVFAPGLDSSNWGLIFQSDAEISDIINNVVSQWIGNLVTPALWDAEILNDGLRSFIADQIMSKDSDKQEEVLEKTLQSIYSMNDAYNFQHGQENNNASQATEFKIALVFRMLYHSLGETTLKQGLQRFISEAKYKSYMDVEIWNAITEQANVDGTLQNDVSVNQIADSWFSENGVPVLKVIRNYRDNSATFSQHVYKRIKPNNLEDETDSDHKWLIPIVLIKENNLDFTNTSPLTWLKEESTRLTKMGNRDSFILANPEEIGPFPVNYDERNWQLISDFLQKEENKDKIPSATRTKLLNDALNLAYLGELSYKTALDMVLFLKNEDSHFVWQRFFETAFYISMYLEESPTVYEKYLNFLRQWILALYDRLGSDSSEDEDKILFKADTKTMLCEVGYKPCVEEAKTNFEKWVESDASATCEMDIVSNICYVFEWGTDEDFELGLPHLIDYSADNGTIIGLSKHELFNNVVNCAVRPWQVEQMLNISVFERVDDFTDSDLEIIFDKLTENSVGYKTLFEYVVQNWDALKERFEGRDEPWKILIKSATSHFKTQDGLDLVKNLYSERRDEFGEAESTIQEAITTVEEEAARSSVNYPVIEEWLDNYLKGHEYNTGDSFVSYER